LIILHLLVTVVEPPVNWFNDLLNEEWIVTLLQYYILNKNILKTSNRVLFSISINFAYQMSFRAFWLASWLVNLRHYLLLFKKNDKANLVSKSTKYWKNRPRKRKKHKMLYLTWKIGFLYYFTVSNIFTDNLKLLKHSLQTISKNFPDCWEKPWYSF
jgi:hypothetical protein